MQLQYNSEDGKKRSGNNSRKRKSRRLSSLYLCAFFLSFTLFGRRESASGGPRCNTARPAGIGRVAWNFASWREGRARYSRVQNVWGRTSMCVRVDGSLREDESIGGNCCRWTVSNRVCAIARRSKVHGEGGCDAELCG